jgi:transposase
MGHFISKNKIKAIYGFYNSGVTSVRGTARILRISKNTLKVYLEDLNWFSIEFPDKKSDIDYFISITQKTKLISERKDRLYSIFPSIYESIEKSNSNLKTEWQKYYSGNNNGYRSSQFSFYFSKWLTENKLIITPQNCRLKTILDEDIIILKKWRLSLDRRKWEKAVVLLELSKGTSLSEIEKRVERSHDKIIEWIKLYEKNGLKGLEKRKKKVNAEILNNIERKKSNLITLIHETPKNYGINRASWSLNTLGEAYLQKFGTKISRTMISEYIRSLGYAFRKAKKVLTSPDPNYREKLQNITNILSNLTDKQKFFSVDEFGPFAVKIQGGRSLVKEGEFKTFPQWQISKGCLICTAALELSHNQITHFYSAKKNTDEMIKLLEILIQQYRDEEKIFFSWDAASWHASKKLNDKIEEINSDEYRNINKTPEVELAPLPASAQFLNVIESVFSGMAKSIIHNSDYQSADECKLAIDQYFKDRNAFYIIHPKRAGKKIWGNEKHIPEFDETKNFKDPKWR